MQIKSLQLYKALKTNSIFNALSNLLLVNVENLAADIKNNR